jgi:hypothetical protein
MFEEDNMEKCGGKCKCAEKQDAFKINEMVKGAIRDALVKALEAKPVKVHVANGQDHELYMIDGEIYSHDMAVGKILGEYSWWND